MSVDDIQIFIVETQLKIKFQDLTIYTTQIVCKHCFPAQIFRQGNDKRLVKHIKDHIKK